MRYAGLLKNDFINGEGVCVSVWLQGCPFHCEGCHNPSTWDREGGKEIDEEEFIDEILDALYANGLLRNLSILGGEPLAPWNRDFSNRLAFLAKKRYPDIKVFLWTGYLLEEVAPYINSSIDVVIDGPFILANRNITLKLRGSPNQRIWRRDKNGQFQRNN